MTEAGYFCSYVPWEILAACGWRSIFLAPSHPPSFEVEALFPVPFCPLSKMVGEAIHSGNFDLFLFALSCDASRRTREIVESFFPRQKVLSLEVPFGESAWRVQRFAQEIRNLARALAERKGFGLPEVEMRLGEIIEHSLTERQNLSALFFEGKLSGRALLDYENERNVSPIKVEAPLLLSGSHLFVEEVLDLLEERGIPVVEETPRGARRWVVLPSRGEFVPSSDPFLDLARLYLHYKLPCPREWKNRIKALQEVVARIGVRGMVYLYPKFCDPALYDLARIRASLRIPLLPLEYELTPNLPQWSTRLDAFLEVIYGEKGH
jgi:benzoyl-CoA reductase/2-hydroxyglutaryl-CoA dehydratase subunit BcrC/BadD/HgdB